jgi:hypothetical protein
LQVAQKPSAVAVHAVNDAQFETEVVHVGHVSAAAELSL